MFVKWINNDIFPEDGNQTRPTEHLKSAEMALSGRHVFLCLKPSEALVIWRHWSFVQFLLLLFRQRCVKETHICSLRTSSCYVFQYFNTNNDNSPSIAHKSMHDRKLSLHYFDQFSYRAIRAICCPRAGHAQHFANLCINNDSLSHDFICK